MNRDDPSTPPADGHSVAHGVGSEHYEIRVAGRLTARWGAWFDGLSLAPDDDGTTVISGPVVDQAALHGLLQKLRDLGLTLLSLTRAAPTEPSEHPVSPTTNDPTTPGATP